MVQKRMVLPAIPVAFYTKHTPPNPINAASVAAHIRRPRSSNSLTTFHSPRSNRRVWDLILLAKETNVGFPVCGSKLSTTKYKVGKRAITNMSKADASGDFVASIITSPSFLKFVENKSGIETSTIQK